MTPAQTQSILAATPKKHHAEVKKFARNNAKYDAQVDVNAQANRDSCPKQERFYNAACEAFGSFPKTLQRKINQLIGGAY